MRIKFLVIGIIFYQSLFSQTNLTGLWISNFKETIEIQQTDHGLSFSLSDNGDVREVATLKYSGEEYSGVMRFKSQSIQCIQNLKIIEEDVLLSEYSDCSDAVNRLNSFWIKSDKQFRELSSSEIDNFNNQFLSLLRNYGEKNHYAFAYSAAYKISNNIEDKVKYNAYLAGYYSEDKVVEYALYYKAKAESDNEYMYCNNYITKYPNGEFITEIVTIKDEKENKEKSLYNSTIKNNDFDTYGLKYPQGKYVSAVNEQKQMYLEKEKAIAEQKRIAKQKQMEEQRIAKQKQMEEQRLAAIKREKQRIDFLKNGVGKKVSWTIEVSYKTSSSGIIGDAIMGALGGLYTTYNFKYIAIIEGVIGENVKVIISNVVLDQPSYVSSNYIKYRDYAKEKELENLGKTRVKGFNEVNIE